MVEASLDGWLTTGRFNELFEKQEDSENIRIALEKISIENRTIILLHNGEEMTFEEISEILGKPMNTVKSQYRRSLILLKAHITKSIAPKSQ